MGVGNLTELTDVDSAGVNVLLAGFCQELGIRSVLTTEVINWCRSCVRELDLARRLVYHAVHERVLPKHLEPDLVMLRDPKLYEHGEEGLRQLARDVTDRNYRLFAEARRDARHQRLDAPARHRPVRAVRRNATARSETRLRRTRSTSATKWPRR